MQPTAPSSSAMRIGLAAIIGLAVGSGLLFFLVVLFICLRMQRRTDAKLEEGDIFTPVKQRPTAVRGTHGPPQVRVQDSEVTLATENHNEQLPKLFATPGSIEGPRRPRHPVSDDSSSGNYLGVPIGVSRHLSKRTDDSASIYSAASAPLELHNQLLSDSDIQHAVKRFTLPSGMETPMNITRDTGLFAMPRAKRRGSILVERETASNGPLQFKKGQSSPNPGTVARRPSERLVLSHGRPGQQSHPPRNLRLSSLQPPSEPSSSARTVSPSVHKRASRIGLTTSPSISSFPPPAW